LLSEFPALPMGKENMTSGAVFVSERTPTMNQFSQTFQGIGFALQLTWGDPLMPVQVDGPLGQLASLPFAQLEGTGVLLTTMWGPVSVRLDRKNDTPGFSVTNNEIPLVAGPVCPVNPMTSSAQSQQMGSGGKTLAIVLGSVVAVVSLLAIVMIVSTAILKDKVGGSLSKVSGSLGLVVHHNPKPIPSYVHISIATNGNDRSSTNWRG
jgi:hypothetical protein